MTIKHVTNPPLTTRECADWIGTSPDYIRGEIIDGKLEAESVRSSSNTRMSYRVPFNAFVAWLRGRGYTRIPACSRDMKPASERKSTEPDQTMRRPPNVEIINPWVQRAIPLIKSHYPDGWLILECPKMSCGRWADGSTRCMVGDVAVFSQPPEDLDHLRIEDLVCVVEVGDLSGKDRLQAWERVLPSRVRVWWIPKTDLQPELDKYRLHSRPNGWTNSTVDSAEV